MPDLVALELKAHLPAKDFELSKRFYQDIGFTVCWSSEGMAYLHYGPCSDEAKTAFLLQKFYSKEFGEHLQMHLLVNGVDAWWAHIQAQRIPEKYSVEVGEPEDREWGIRDFTLFDPSGILWRIGESMKERNDDHQDHSTSGGYRHRVGARHCFGSVR